MRTWHFSNFYFFYFATIGIIMPYWSLYLNHIGFSAKEIGQLMAIFLFTKMIAPNIWAAIADSVAAKRGSSLGLLKFAAVATLLIYSLMAVVESFWAVGAVMLGYCVFWNASLPQLEAATLNHLQDKRQYGRVRLWGSWGFIVTVLGLGVLMDFSGPSSILPAGGVALVALVIASLFMRDGSIKPADTPQQTVRVFEVLNWRVMTLLALCVLMQLSHAPLQTFMSLYLLEYGYTNWQVGLLWTTGVLFEIVIFIYAYKILHRFRLSHLLTFTFAVAALRWVLVAQYPEFPVVVFLTQAMHAITFGLYHAVMMQLIDRLFVGRYQIRGQALYSSLSYGLGGAVGSFISGYIWTDIGKQELFLFCGVLMIFVSVFSFFFVHKLTHQVSR